MPLTGQAAPHCRLADGLKPQHNPPWQQHAAAAYLWLIKRWSSNPVTSLTGPRLASVLSLHYRLSLSFVPFYLPCSRTAELPTLTSTCWSVFLFFCNKYAKITEPAIFCRKHEIAILVGSYLLDIASVNMLIVFNCKYAPSALLQAKYDSSLMSCLLGQLFIVMNT